MVSYYQPTFIPVSNTIPVITAVPPILLDVNHIQFIDVGSSSDPLILPYHVPFNFIWNGISFITLQTVTHHFIPSVIVSGFSYYYTDFLRRHFTLYTYPAVHFTFPGSFFLDHPFMRFEDNYPNRLIALSKRYPNISRNIYIGAYLLWFVQQYLFLIG